MNERTIKIYDLDALLHQECGLEAFRYQKVAVLEGPRGIVVAEEEAVHKRVNVLSDTVQIDANKPAAPGTLWLLPSYQVTISVQEIKEAPFQEMTMSAFFRRRDYNPRCQSNWRTLLSSLSAIGFDLSGYLPDKKPLDQTITQAEKKKIQPQSVQKDTRLHEH